MERQLFTRVEFYRDDDGDKPVARSLREWDLRKPELAVRAKSELTKLQYRQYQGTADIPAIKGDRYRGLWELRIRGHLDARFIFFWDGEETIVVVHVFENKSRHPPKDELETAWDRRRRHQQRGTMR